MSSAESIYTPRHEVLASGYQFLEAPRVDDSGAVYFSDLLAGGFYRRTPDGDIRRYLPERKWIGGIVLDEDGSVICSGCGGIVRLDLDTGNARPVLTRMRGAEIDAVNDIEADADGALYGGTIDFTSILGRGAAPAPGVFFRIDPDGEVHIIREGVAASNGIAFSPDGRLLYHAESTRGVWVYDLDPHGLPRNPTLFAEVADCDGIAVDSEAAIWVARWETGEIVRYRADATIDRRMRLPYPYLVSLTFGGKDLCDLIVATGGKTSATAPRQGAVVRVRCDVPGLASHKARLQ
jgi:sugar lactone lactonase YvrE